MIIINCERYFNIANKLVAIFSAEFSEIFFISVDEIVLFNENIVNPCNLLLGAFESNSISIYYGTFRVEVCCRDKFNEIENVLRIYEIEYEVIEAGLSL